MPHKYSTKENPKVCIVNFPHGARRVCFWSENGKSRSTYYSRRLWEKINSKIPKGYHIHHKDADTLNDCMENYELLSSSNHSNHHWNRDREYILLCKFLRRHNRMDCIKKHEFLLMWSELNGNTCYDKLKSFMYKYEIKNFQQLSILSNIDIGQRSKLKSKNYGLGNKNIQRLFIYAKSY